MYIQEVQLDFTICVQGCLTQESKPKVCGSTISTSIEKPEESIVVHSNLQISKCLNCWEIPLQLCRLPMYLTIPQQPS